MKAKNPIWVPVLFTLAYFSYALLSPIHADWFKAVVRFFLLSAAAVSSVLLWACYGLWFHRKSRSLGWLFGIGLLPVAILGVFALYSLYRSHHLASLDSKIKTESRLIRIDDEELLTARGNPIGVRLHYEVHYPKGSGELIPHVPPANLSMVPLPYLMGFWVRNTESRALNATDYSMTVDVVPEFMPKMIRFLETPNNPGSGSPDPCFWWARGPSERITVLSTAPQAFWIYLSAPQYSARTQRSYDLQRFYEGALNEGTKECS